MLVYSSTQHPTEAQHGVANILGVPVNDITVEVRRMGGAFGEKKVNLLLLPPLPHSVHLRLVNRLRCVLGGMTIW